MFIKLCFAFYFRNDDDNVHFQKKSFKQIDIRNSNEVNTTVNDNEQRKNLTLPVRPQYSLNKGTNR